MTQVEFYILENDQSREMMACHLVEKAWQQQHRVHIHTESAAQAKKLDEMLWSFSDDSFIPHEIGSHNEKLATVSIDHAADPVCHEMLINLAAELDPEGYRADEAVRRVAGIRTRLRKILERAASQSVTPEEAARAQARERIGTVRKASFHPGL